MVAVAEVAEADGVMTEAVVVADAQVAVVVEAGFN